MKIIDLLNKIANGEEVPKKVRYNGIIYGYNNSNKHGLRYCDLEDDINTTFCFLITNINSLNDEVEIIEEQDIDIQSIEEIEPAMNGNACVIDNKTWTLNQVIKAVKQLDKKIKEK